MTLHFANGKESQINVIKETKKYIVFRADNGFKYRLNKETGEVQDGTYHTVIKELYVRK